MSCSLQATCLTAIDMGIHDLEQQTGTESSSDWTRPLSLLTVLTTMGNCLACASLDPSVEIL